MTILEKVLALSEMELFQAVPTDELSLLATIASEEAFDRGEQIIVENEPADSLFLLLSGEATLSRSGKTVSSVRKNDVLGAWALLEVEPYLVTATATQPVEVLQIDRESFYDLISDHPEVTQGILRSLVKKVRRLLEPLEKEINDNRPGEES